MADVPEFPDINPILFLDPRGRLCLMWYTVIANQWETSQPRYRISNDYQMADGPPKWEWQDVLYVKCGDKAERGVLPTDRFVASVARQVEEYREYLTGGNAALGLVAYMRDNGPPPKRLHVSRSPDTGLTWSGVRDSEVANPGSGADVVTLRNGRWVLAYNDTTDGRHSLAVSLSEDGGKTWGWTRHLALDERGRDAATSFAYPSIIQGADGRLHVVYSCHGHDAGGEAAKTIKYVCFDEAWVRE